MPLAYCAAHDDLRDTYDAPDCPACAVGTPPTNPDFVPVAPTPPAEDWGIFIQPRIEPTDLVTISDQGVERFRIDREGNIYAYGRLATTDIEVRDAARAFCGLPPYEEPKPEPGPPKSRFEIIEDL